MIVFRNNMRTFFSSPTRLGIVFLLPLIFIMLFISGEDGGIPTKVAIIDYDDTELTRSLILEIEQSSTIVECDEYEILDMLINAKLDYALTIPAGYTQQVLAGEEVYITERYFINEQKLYPLMLNIQTYINNAINIHSVSTSEEDFYNKLSQIKDYGIGYEQNTIEINSAENTASALGFMIQFLMYSGIITAAFLLHDKESNVMTRVLVSPKSMTGYILEHFSSYVVIELIICLVLTTALKLIFNYQFNGYFVLITLLVMLFAVSITAFSIMVVSICKNSKISYWVMICVTSPMVMIGGCYFEISSMPTVVENASIFLPTTWIMDAIRGMLMANSAEKASITAIVLLAFTVVYLSIGRIGLKSLLQHK